MCFVRTLASDVSRAWHGFSWKTRAKGVLVSCAAFTCYSNQYGQTGPSGTGTALQQLTQLHGGEKNTGSAFTQDAA